MKKIISVVLAVVMALSMMSLTVFASGIQGDVNDSGKVTAIDASMILQYVAGLTTPENTGDYDVNDDGKITGVDASIVLQIVAGLREPEVDLNDGGNSGNGSGGSKPVIPPADDDEPVTPPADDDEPVTPPQDDMTKKSQEEQLVYFNKSFNGVKTNAKTAVNKNVKLYNYNDYVKINSSLEALYDLTAEAGAPSMRETLTADLSDELIAVNKTYEGSEAIAAVFPPIGGTCNLTMNDVSNIFVTSLGEYYIVELKVKGKKNPGRYESIGNVASIVTKADLEADLTAEDKEMMSMDCDYKEATVKAKIEKTTGNMVEYSVDYPMIMIINIVMFGNGAVEVGMGFYEDWTIAY